MRGGGEGRVLVLTWVHWTRSHLSYSLYGSSHAKQGEEGRKYGGGEGGRGLSLLGLASKVS